MALSQPDLSVSLELVDNDHLEFSDNTGSYDADDNPLGYGLPGGLTADDVTDVTLTLTYNKLGVSVVYTFEVTSLVITAATISIDGASAVDILAELESTDFPLQNFNITSGHGETLPDFDDDVFEATYRIQGTADDGGSPTAFDYSSVDWEAVSYFIRAEVDQLWADLDPVCDCDSEKKRKVELAEAYVKKFLVAGERGDLDKALECLELAEQHAEECS